MLIAQLTEWTKRTFEPLGATGLFILAFIESSFFPIPPDLLLVILVLASPEKALFFALICTLGSVLGGMFGYSIGYVGEKAILEKFFSHRKIDRVHRLFNRFEAWAIFIASFTPIPYKVFTIAAGVFYVNFKKFVLASLIGRGLRYFILAILVSIYGETIMNFIDKYFNLITIISVILLIVVYFFYKKRKNSI